MKRPSFQFYPADWKSNINLRRCSFAARGAWMDVICSLHDSDEYGILRWPLKDIAAAIGSPVSLLKELVAKGVLKGSDSTITEPYTYTPRSGRKDGNPVILVEAQDGPLWYSSRMVKDEYIRTIRGESSRFGEVGEQKKQPPKSSPKHAPKGGFGEVKGDGSSSSSSSSPSGVPQTPTSDLSDFDDETMTETTAKQFAEIQKRINTLNPRWKPAFTFPELTDLKSNARFLFDLNESDWKLLTAYFHAVIPDTLGKFWRPAGRGKVIQQISDMMALASEWKSACKRAGIPTGLETRKSA